MQPSHQNTAADVSRGFHQKTNSWPPSAYVEQSCTVDQTFSSSISTSASHPYSPEITSCSAASNPYVSHKLKEIASEMLGPAIDAHADANNVALPSEAKKWISLEEIVARGDLKEVLSTCARSMEDNDLYSFELLITELSKMVNVSGDPIQRLGAYMMEGLVARVGSSGSAIYKALKCKEPTGSELFSYMYLLYDICPYFKFGHLSANGAIAEAMKDEMRIHVIDFQVAQGGQWVTLIQALAGRPGGPPHFRLTGIDDSTSSYTRGGGLSVVGERLKKLAERNGVPFEFTEAKVSASEITLEHIEIREGEATAVNFPLMLHHMLDESAGQNNRDRLIRMAKMLSPKVVTLVEQESNNNTAPFFARFLETMRYYLAVFESIDVTLPRNHKERINVEQHCLAREVVNIIACEGVERVERHELLGKWKSRFNMAGFTQYPLNTLVNSTIKTLLENYSDQYTLEERDGALYLGWHDRQLITSSAWR